jgi:hypothetical protein
LARYGAEGMPSVFVVDAEGTIRFTDAGYSPEHLDDLARAIRELVPGPPAAEATGPATHPSAACTPLAPQGGEIRSTTPVVPAGTAVPLAST